MIHVDPPRTPDAYVPSKRPDRAGRSDGQEHPPGRGSGDAASDATPARRPDRGVLAAGSRPREGPQGAPEASAPPASCAPVGRCEWTDAQLEYAKQLLEEKDPRGWSRRSSRWPRLPLPMSRCRCRDSIPSPRGGAGERARVRAAPGRRHDRERPSGYTKFSVSWGEKSGATTSRVLSHVLPARGPPQPSGRRDPNRRSFFDRRHRERRRGDLRSAGAPPRQTGIRGSSSRPADGATPRRGRTDPGRGIAVTVGPMLRRPLRPPGRVWVHRPRVPLHPSRDAGPRRSDPRGLVP